MLAVLVNALLLVQDLRDLARDVVVKLLERLFTLPASLPTLCQSALVVDSPAPAA